MINWCGKKTLFAIFLCSFWGTELSAALAVPKSIRFELNTNFIVAQSLDYNDGLSIRLLECQEIDPAYQEVFSFETENLLISICQLGNSFYYHRQSKFDSTDNVLISAQAVYRGSVFQASDGKTTYFVGKNGDRYYSSVMQNNDEIIFEPQLQSPDPDLSQDLAEVNSSLPAKTRLTQTDNASLELDDPAENAEQVLICTREKSAFHPRLNGWQKLIGKSTTTANKYAVNNGYEFVYNEQTPNIASIITVEGIVVNLSLTNQSEMVEQVCIQPESDN
ncbi:MAG: hypothetical protein AAGF83_21885 [Cyanobacteria bacterium P01_G01_bin.67]